MENKKLSCIDCTVANCNHQQKSYPDFCLTTNMDPNVLEDAMKLYEEDEENTEKFILKTKNASKLPASEKQMFTTLTYSFLTK